MCEPEICEAQKAETKEIYELQIFAWYGLFQGLLLMGPPTRHPVKGRMSYGGEETQHNSFGFNFDQLRNEWKQGKSGRQDW